MRKACMWALFTALVMCVSPSSQGSNRNVPLVDRSSWSLKTLVAELQVEHEDDEGAHFQAVSYHAYDRVVGEILRRADIDVVPLLLERVNDETLVVLKDHPSQAWRCWYNVPVRVKHKVRFTLERLLEPHSFHALVGNPLDAKIDIQAAREYFSRQKGKIRLRPSREAAEDEAIIQDPKQLPIKN